MQEPFPTTEALPVESGAARAVRIGKAAIREILETLALFVIVMAVSRFLIGNYIIEQTSAVPNYMPGDRILVDQQIYKVTGGLKRGDLIVLDRNQGRDDDFNIINQASDWFRSWTRGGVQQATGRERLFKRIIGLPGETLEIRDNAVYINSKRLIEPYIAPENLRNGNVAPRKLGDDEYWVMGDNRGGSQDSRNWNTGIRGGDVVGRAWLRYYPFEKLQLIRGVTYEP